MGYERLDSSQILELSSKFDCKFKSKEMICENIFKSFFNTHIRLKSFLLSCRDVFRRSISLFKLVVLNLFVRFFLRHPKYNKKYKISICGIFKNESCFLKEWIEYHEILGVEHFYLYNNLYLVFV